MKAERNIQASMIFGFQRLFFVCFFYKAYFCLVSGKQMGIRDTNGSPRRPFESWVYVDDAKPNFIFFCLWIIGGYLFIYVPALQSIWIDAQLAERLGEAILHLGGFTNFPNEKVLHDTRTYVGFSWLYTFIPWLVFSACSGVRVSRTTRYSSNTLYENAFLLESRYFWRTILAFFICIGGSLYFLYVLIFRFDAFHPQEEFYEIGSAYILFAPASYLGMALLISITLHHAVRIPSLVYNFNRRKLQDEQ